MSINLYDTHTMLEAVKMMPPKSTFLRDRYFPTAPRDIFDTTDILVDFVDEVGNKLAPAVLPHVGGIPVEREGYTTDQLDPPTLAPSRTLSADQLAKRKAGEAVFGGMSPQERQASYLRDDLEVLNAVIDAREEYMAAQCLLNAEYTLNQFADKYGSSEYISKNLKFYTGLSNPGVYNSSYWTAQSTNIISDIAAMAELLKKRGLPATDLILSASATDTFLANEEVRSLLDNRRIVLADELRPQERADGAVFICRINAKGHLIDVYSYIREYTADNGTSTPYITDKYAIMTAPNMGRTAYGAVTQIEGDDNFVTYAAKRVPQVIVDKTGNSKTVIMRAKPIVMPKVRTAAISAKVIS